MHCGDSRFDEKLMEAAINEINQLNPDLIVVPGDLTRAGYKEQFEEANSFISQLKCPQKIVIAGNHDCRNVGFLFFEDIFGPRNKTLDFEFKVCCGEIMQERIKIVASDSNKPDLNDGEIGRDHYRWIKEQFTEENHFKVFVLHHHLVSVPGTGRERNIVWDAGDVLKELREAGVDLVLAGHRHVPYVWPLADMFVVNSGTVSTWRTRGYIKPSYNIINIRPGDIEITIKTPGEKEAKAEKFPRKVLK